MVGAKPRGTTLPPCLCALVVRLAQAAATRLSRGDCRVLQRGNGAHTLAAWCLGRGCNHFRVLDVSAYPDDVTVPSFGRRLWCGRWGHRGAEARPKWSEMHKHADERLSAMHPIATEYIAAQRMTRSANKRHQPVSCTANSGGGWRYGGSEHSASERGFIVCDQGRRLLMEPFLRPELQKKPAVRSRSTSRAQLRDQ